MNVKKLLIWIFIGFPFCVSLSCIICYFGFLGIAHFNQKLNPPSSAESQMCDYYLSKIVDIPKTRTIYLKNKNVANITDSKLKDLYFDQKKSLDIDIYRGKATLKKNKKNYIKIRHAYTKNIYCLETMEFYAQNDCKGEQDCYMLVKSVPEKTKNAPSINRKYFLIIK